MKSHHEILSAMIATFWKVLDIPQSQFAALLREEAELYEEAPELAVERDPLQPVTVKLRLPSTERNSEPDRTENVVVQPEDIERIDGSSIEDRAVAAAREILFDAPAFDHISVTEIEESEVLSVDLAGEATDDSIEEQKP